MSELKDTIKIKGRLEIFNARTGELLFEKDNLVVNNGLNFIVDRLKSNTPNVLSHIAVGTNNTPVSSTDIQLYSELLRKAITDINTIDNVLTVETQYEDFEALGHWYECGVFNAITSGVMFNRIIIDFLKTTEDAVRVKFTFTITAS
jgi:hypothetical protein